MSASGFQDIRDAIMRDVDRAFAETIRHLPLKNGVVDPDRAARDIAAVLRVGGGSTTARAGVSAGAWRTNLVSGKAELHIDRVTYAGLIVRPKDKVRALERPGLPLWEVASIEDREGGRLILQLGEV